ncbi:ABC transporter ATP-binding protein [bacterium]|nr:ABC transporter ATP-binding protein [bacterium]
MNRLLAVADLRLNLPGESGRLAPVDGVSFHIEAGECVGLVGESGCGKSLTALSLLGLTSGLPGARVSGRAEWTFADGRQIDLLKLRERDLTGIRGHQIAMVFQDPLSALNPLLKIDYQIGEVLKKHRKLTGKAARERAVELLALTGIPQPDKRAGQYPHQLSGGLRQRALLAMALAGEPRLLIADEPTTALDVTVQAQILMELKNLREQQGQSVLFITHDLGVVAQLCTRVIVMYAGRIVEEASVKDFFTAPRHPYSRGLLASLPSVAGERNDLVCITGSPPRPGAFPPGCRFHPRCRFADDRCMSQYPEFMAEPGRAVACWHPQEDTMFSANDIN